MKHSMKTKIASIAMAAAMATAMAVPTFAYTRDDVMNTMNALHMNTSVGIQAYDTARDTINHATSTADNFRRNVRQTVDVVSHNGTGKGGTWVKSSSTPIRRVSDSGRTTNYYPTHFQNDTIKDVQESWSNFNQGIASDISSLIK